MDTSPQEEIIDSRPLIALLSRRVRAGNHCKTNSVSMATDQRHQAQRTMDSLIRRGYVMFPASVFRPPANLPNSNSNSFIGLKHQLVALHWTHTKYTIKKTSVTVKHSLNIQHYYILLRIGLFRRSVIHCCTG